MATESRGDLLVLLAAGVAVAALAIRMTNFGWTVLFYGLIYLAICVIHVVVHRRVARSARLPWTAFVSIGMSHLVLLSAFLLQWDFGDSSGQDLTLRKLLNVGPGVPAWLRDSWLGPGSPPMARLGDGMLVPVVAVVISWISLASLRASGWVGMIAFGVNVAIGCALGGAVFVATGQMYADDAQRERAALQRAGGAAPAKCGADPLPIVSSNDPLIDQAVGRSPVWMPKGRLTARSGDLLLNRLGHLPDGKLATTWLVDAASREPIVVSVTDSSTGRAIRSNQLRSGAGTTQTLDPARPFMSQGRHLLYIVEFFVPQAGCYAISATWSGGSWRVALAAGQ